VVQTFNPHQRVAELLFMDTQEKATVSVLELDPGGSGKANYGVGFGQHVLLCADNGTDLPEVPALGQFEPPIDNMWWRNELAKLAEQYADGDSGFDFVLPAGDPSAIKWWGEVIQLHLDGKVTVKLPSGEERRVDIKNVIRLNEPAGDMFEDELGAVEGQDTGFVEEEAGSEASWETMDDARDDLDLSDVRRGEGWEENVDEEQDVEMFEDDVSAQDAEEVEPMVSEPEWRDEVQAAVGAPVAKATRTARHSQTAEAGPSTQPNGHASSLPSLEDDEQWQQFEILEQAPEEHWFYKEPRLEAASKAYHTRLQKEHRALMTSLPGRL
jgi:ubiquitin-conjugating enzyme E2 O